MQGWYIEINVWNIDIKKKKETVSFIWRIEPDNEWFMFGPVPVTSQSTGEFPTYWEDEMRGFMKGNERCTVLFMRRKGDGRTSTHFM